LGTSMIVVGAVPLTVKRFICSGAARHCVAHNAHR
jgi:hypothetical protein